jgi:hypothetical protein
MSDLRHDRGATGSVAPDFLTVEETGEVLRIGRTAAYQLARQFLATDGVAGIPVVRYGRQLRVPRCRLEDVLGGPITWPPHAPAVSSLPAFGRVVEAARVAPPRRPSSPGDW